MSPCEARFDAERLEGHPWTVHAKCVDLSPSDAAATPLPGSPAISVAGLVSHLRWSEAFWIDVIFLGQRYQWPGTDDDSELQMRAGLERPLADLLGEYEVQAAHTDEVVDILRELADGVTGA